MINFGGEEARPYPLEGLQNPNKKTSMVKLFALGRLSGQTQMAYTGYYHKGSLLGTRGLLGGTKPGATGMGAGRSLGLAAIGYKVAGPLGAVAGLGLAQYTNKGLLEPFLGANKAKELAWGKTKHGGSVVYGMDDAGKNIFSYDGSKYSSDRTPGRTIYNKLRRRSSSYNLRQGMSQQVQGVQNKIGKLAANISDSRMRQAFAPSNVMSDYAFANPSPSSLHISVPRVAPTDPVALRQFNDLQEDLKIANQSRVNPLATGPHKAQPKITPNKPSISEMMGYDQPTRPLDLINKARASVPGLLRKLPVGFNSSELSKYMKLRGAGAAQLGNLKHASTGFGIRSMLKEQWANPNGMVNQVYNSISQGRPVDLNAMISGPQGFQNRLSLMANKALSHKQLGAMTQFAKIAAKVPRHFLGQAFFGLRNAKLDTLHGAFYQTYRTVFQKWKSDRGINLLDTAKGSVRESAKFMKHMKMSPGEISEYKEAARALRSTQKIRDATSAPSKFAEKMLAGGSTPEEMQAAWAAKQTKAAASYDTKAAAFASKYRGTVDKAAGSLASYQTAATAAQTTASAIARSSTWMLAGSLAATAINASVKGAWNLSEKIRTTVSKLGTLEFGSGKVLSTEMASTERQRALSTIQTNRMQASSYLGGEAQRIAGR